MYKFFSGRQLGMLPSRASAYSQPWPSFSPSGKCRGVERRIPDSGCGVKMGARGCQQGPTGMGSK